MMVSAGVSAFEHPNKVPIGTTIDEKSDEIGRDAWNASSGMKDDGAPRNDKNGVARAMTIRVFDGGMCHVGIEMVSYGFKPIVICGKSGSAGPGAYDRRRNCIEFEENTIRGSVGDCGVACNWSKGQENDRFQKEMGLFEGEECGDSECGISQGVGNEEVVVEIAKRMNVNDLGGSRR